MKKLRKFFQCAAVCLAVVLIFTVAPARPVRAEDEGTGGFVTRLYEICLGREPDAGGYADWVNRLSQKQISGSQAAAGFFFSKEFQNDNLCDSCYVDSLYRAFLGREPDAGGKAGWLNALRNGETRGKIFTGFAMSEEFKKLCASYGIDRGSGDWSGVRIPIMGNCSWCGADNDTIPEFVTRLYEICLGREPDAGGLSDWTQKLLNGSSGAEVIYGFVASPEFVNHRYDDTTYVRMLYRAFFGREADAGGLQNWVKALAGGMSRGKVFNGFVRSREFTSLCARYGIRRGDFVRAGFTIALDPGHSAALLGGVEPIGPGSGVMKARDNSGTAGVATGIAEYAAAMDIANMLRTELQKRGYRVVLTRENNSTPASCVQRAEIANQAGADAFIRLHFNSWTNSALTGAQAICVSRSNSWAASTYADSRKLSESVINAYCAETGIRKDQGGVVERDDLTGNNWSRVPCTLIEMGYMSNPAEDRKMADAAFRQKMVKGLADGIDTYIETKNV